MRYRILLVLCLAALSLASAQDTQSTNTSYKQVVYKNPDTNATITLTGPDTLLYQADGNKRTGKYTIKDKSMHVVWDGKESTPSENDYNIPMDGVLFDAVNKDGYATDAVLQKIQEKGLATKCMSNAKQIALGCKLYASDNNGQFPAKLSDLVPTYIQDEKLFVSPLSAKKEAMGFEYFGAGGFDTDQPDKILLRSKDTTADGRRIIVHFDCSGEIKADK